MKLSFITLIFALLLSCTKPGIASEIRSHDISLLTLLIALNQSDLISASHFSSVPAEMIALSQPSQMQAINEQQPVVRSTAPTGAPMTVEGGQEELDELDPETYFDSASETSDSDEPLSPLSQCSESSLCCIESEPSSPTSPFATKARRNSI